jgi:hypothetical protein
MADESILDKFGSFFTAGNMNDPRVNSQLRQRIALQMMGQGAKKGYPKNIGEGLTAIGDSLGDIGMARQLAASDIAGQEQATRAVAQPAAAPVMSGAPIMNYAPEGGDGAEPAVAPPAVAAAPPVVAGPPPETGLPPAQPPPAETYTPPTPEQVNSSRNALTRGLLARQTAAGGPPPNPLLAGAVPASISTAAPSPSPEQAPGSQPDPRLALNAPPQDARGAVTDIRPAPPVPSQIRQEPQQLAQAQQSYPPGYVPPPAADPSMPPTVQMHPRELQLRRLIAQNPGNPYYATAAAPELQTLTLDREKRQAYADELFKSKLARGATQDSKRLEGQMDQAKRIADIEHTRAQAEAQKLQDVSGKMVRNLDGSYSPVKLTGVDQNAVPDVKLTESQTKSLLYHDWVKIGNEVVSSPRNEKLLAEGMAQEALGKVPFAGNKLQDAKYRKAKTAADQFVNGWMRATSGGAYGVEEAAREARALLPKPGDDPQTLELKRIQRDGMVKNVYASLGDGKRVADYYGKEREGALNKKRETLAQEMEGKDKGKTYQKGNVFREWNGSYWEEH